MKTIQINYPGGSLLEIRKKYGNFYDQSWYNNQPFASVKIPKGKWAVCLEAAPDSFSKTWKEQQATLPKGAIVPPTAVLAYALIKYKEEIAEYAFSDKYLRCSDLDVVGDHVYVGVYSKSVFVNRHWGGYRVSLLGLASAWKRDLKSRELDTPETLSLPSELNINGITYRRV